MAKGGAPPAPKKTGAITAQQALNQMLGGASSLPRFEVPKETQEAIARLAASMGQLQIPSTPTVLGSGLPATESLSKPISNEEASEAEGAIAGGGRDKKPPRKPKRTSLDRIPGRRPMREYPLTEDDLDTIGLLQGAAAISFGASGTCFGLFLSVRMAVDFAGNGVSATKISWWAGLSAGALIVAAALFVAGWLLRGQGKTRINRIKQETVHDD